MKKFIALFALVTGFTVLAPASAEAGDRHGSYRQQGSTCGSCGGEVYRQRVVVGYDRHGHPTFAWRTAFHRCAPRSHGGGHGSSSHGSGHGGGDSNHGGGHSDSGSHRRGR